jgi:hypothetical protein
MERKYHAAIPAVVTGIALVSLGATHFPFSSISYASFPLASTASMVLSWSLPSEFLTGFAAAMLDSPVRFSRREELE